MPLTTSSPKATLALVFGIGVVGYVRIRQRGIVASLVVALLAGGVVGACSPFASKGTMPPPGPNGQVDASSAPDFIAVAGKDGGIAGHARKTDVLAPVPAAFPVYADDIRTIVGHMVPGKGFIPAGVDPATVPGRPLEVAPSTNASATGPGAVTLYVRNDLAGQVWVAVQAAGKTTSSGSYWGQNMAVGCYPTEPASRLVLLDRSPTEAGASVMRVIHTRAAEPTSPSLWITIGKDGVVEQGTGIPPWWESGPQTC